MAPAFTVYQDRIEILSKGLLPPKQTMDGFFAGESVPVNEKLARIYDKADFSYVAKMLRLMPAVILIYGSCSAKLQEKLDRVGLNCVVYTDFRRLCKEAT